MTLKESIPLALSLLVTIILFVLNRLYTRKSFQISNFPVLWPELRLILTKTNAPYYILSFTLENTHPAVAVQDVHFTVELVKKRGKVIERSIYNNSMLELLYPKNSAGENSMAPDLYEFVAKHMGGVVKKDVSGQPFWVIEDTSSLYVHAHWEYRTVLYGNKTKKLTDDRWKILSYRPHSRNPNMPGDWKIEDMPTLDRKLRRQLRG